MAQLGVVGALAAARTSSALPPAVFSASAQGLYGNDFASDARVNPYGLGLGLRAGLGVGVVRG